MEGSSLIEQEKKGLDKGQKCDITSSEPRQPSKRIEPPDRIAIGALGLGYTDTPETGEVPAVDGFIGTKPARIMLDSGCSTYALSQQFLRKHKIEAQPTPPIPLDLAETTDTAHEISQQTELLPIEIGDWHASKSFYVIDNKHYDAILGVPFFQSYTPDFDWQQRTVLIQGHSHDLIALEQEVDDPPVPIMTLTRSRFKAMVRRSEVESMFVGVLRPENSEKNVPTKAPAWIMSEYGKAFADELPPGLPPSRTVDHQIPLLPDSRKIPLNGGGMSGSNGI